MKLSCDFWSIFNRYESDDAENSKPPVTRKLLERIKETGTRIYVYTDEQIPVDREGGRKEPEFQKMLEQSMMKDRLKKANIPFDEVRTEKPYSDVSLDSKIMTHKNWENILISKLRGEEARG